MTGSLALDTNAAIAYAARISAVRGIVDVAATLVLPVPVLGELLYGARTSGRAAENERGVWSMAERCEVAPADGAVAARYAAVRAELKARGRPVPENDLWIAAICLERGVPLLTSDCHFLWVPDLDVRGW
ncbi:MAG: PIN domain-containing protein [Deltaproteobacteria bacterium]|nr:PIN domain-containing protein [Deltaproteobacteria bacterium]